MAMPASRLGIVVREIVDHLLDAHRVARRTLPVAQEAPHAVRGAVDVDGERRQRVVDHAEERGCDAENEPQRREAKLDQEPENDGAARQRVQQRVTDARAPLDGRCQRGS